MLSHGPSRLLLQAARSVVVVVRARSGVVAAARVETLRGLVERRVFVLLNRNVSPSAATARPGS